MQQHKDRSRELGKPEKDAFNVENANFVRLFASGFSGSFGLLFVHPLDTIRIRIQTQKNIQRKGFLPTFLEALNKEGLRGLYKGMLSPLVGDFFLTMQMFGLYGYLNTLMIDYPHKELIAGSIVGVLNSLTVTPVELVKIKLQVNTMPTTHVSYQGFMPTVFDLWKNSRNYLSLIGTFYNGYLMTLVREVPMCLLYFGVYKIIHDRFKDHWIIGSLFAGGIAGSVAWASIYPIDCIKSVQQAHHIRTREAAAMIYKEHRWRGFVRGFIPSVLRAFPENAIVFVMFEALMKVLGPPELILEK